MCRHILYLILFSNATSLCFLITVLRAQSSSQQFFLTGVLYQFKTFLLWSSINNSFIYFVLFPLLKKLEKLTTPSDSTFHWPSTDNSKTLFYSILNTTAKYCSESFILGGKHFICLPQWEMVLSSQLPEV